MRHASEICKKTPSLLRKKLSEIGPSHPKRRSNWCQLVGLVFKIKLGWERCHGFSPVADD